MEFFSMFNSFMDAWLMPVYRLPETPIIGFYLGTAVLSVVCVILGDITYNLVIRADRARIKETSSETTRYNNLSIEALQAGDGNSYRACNKMANEAFGRMFFLQLALSTAALWPIPFALSWLQYRFFTVEFPLSLIPLTFGYAGVFIPMYILIRVLYGKINARLPFLRGAKEIFRELHKEAERMKSWQDVFPEPTPKTR